MVVCVTVNDCVPGVVTCTLTKYQKEPGVVILLMVPLLVSYEIVDTVVAVPPVNRVHSVSPLKAVLVIWLAPPPEMVAPNSLGCGAELWATLGLWPAGPLALAPAP